MIEILWHSLFGKQEYPANISRNIYNYRDPTLGNFIAVKSCLNKQRKIHYSYVKLPQKSVITLHKQCTNVIFYEY
jgi:hypothetical protein